MNRIQWPVLLGLAGMLAAASSVRGQSRPYIGFIYPAGGQQGTTVQVRLGGQGMDGVNEAVVSGTGVRAKLVEYRRRMGNQEISLLREQLREMKRKSAQKDAATLKLMARTETIIAEYVSRPACASISTLAIVEVAIAPDAAPGEREIRLATPRGVSNPLVFYVGQLPEVSRKPMLTCTLQILGKEELSLRTRPPDEVEQRITVPCTVNGQVASGEVNWYRFEASKGQRLVLSVQARQLVPFIADAVPGWFQPVLALYDADGNELAYGDDYRFKPDPTVYFEVPKDGEYRFSIIDAIYRGREDFVYRASVGETPFVTSIFPLGGRAGTAAKIEMKGWNLHGAEMTPPPTNAAPGVYPLAAVKGGLVSNRVPFALDSLPECLDKEPNDDPSHAQKVKLPAIVNGRIDRPGDRDVFQVAGRAGDTIVAEVSARRLESPLDSVLKLTDAAGKVLAFDDDHDDPGWGVNTHPADSYLMFKLPADGTYYVHLGDVANNGGEEYAYRLRLSPPQPDFALYIVPSSLALRGKSSGTASIQVLRKDGFDGTISLGLKGSPPGFSLSPGSISPKQTSTRLTVRTTLADTKQPVDLHIEGRAKLPHEEVVHEALAAEDRMQAFLWRHLVPAQELDVLVYAPSQTPEPNRVPRVPAKPPATTQPATTQPTAVPAGKPKFTKQQVVYRLRQLQKLHEEGLLTDSFYQEKVAECEAGL